ncbi:MAG: hypothetical protein R2810_01070 [Flavobacteriales bacterium]
MDFTPEMAARAISLRGHPGGAPGIRFSVDGNGRLTASMPVAGHTKQPVGLLHGGATAALAESLGSMWVVPCSSIRTSRAWWGPK